MGKTIPNEVKRELLNFYENNKDLSCSFLSIRFYMEANHYISTGSVRRIIRHYENTGGEILQANERKSKIQGETLDAVRALIKEDESLTLTGLQRQIEEKLGVSICLSGLSKTLEKHKIQVKKGCKPCRSKALRKTTKGGSNA